MDSLFDIENSDIIYIAEGNANIVVKLPEYKYVLRLPKADKINSGRRELEMLSYLQKCQKYAEILRELLGKDHVYIPQPIEISTDQAKRLNSFMLQYRPKNRLGKEFRGRYAMLMRDATMGLSYATTYSVEIKPKQGWMFDSSLESIFELNGLKMCRYCCMQYLKIKDGKIHTRSNYCPMDLFSGDCSRMEKAIDSLIEAPQNNLRIFKNGELIYGESNRSEAALQTLYDEIEKSEFYSLILNSLAPYSNQTMNEGPIQCEMKYGNGLTKSSQANILKRIVELQLLAKDNVTHMLAKKRCELKSYNALESLVLKQLPLQLQEMTPEEQYMIGATMMDASIMITFHLSDDKRHSACESKRNVNNKSYYLSVTLLDLDPKPDNHFEKYLKQTNEAFAAAKELLQS